ncbi:MAG: hypothetical protein ABJB66_13695 [Gemmatimonadaceae bacterium]
MNSNIETVAMQSGADAQPGSKQFAQNIKMDVLASVREGLVSARADAVRSGDGKAIEKLDEAISKLDKQLVDAQVTRVQIPKLPVAPQVPGPPGGIPGTQPAYRDNYIPPQAVDIVQALGTTLVFCVVGFPLAKAFARWIDRRGTTAPASREVVSRLEAIEQAVESVAVEVERISEGQRFTTKLLNERAQEPAREFAVADREPVSNLPPNARRG